MLNNLSIRKLILKLEWPNTVDDIYIYPRLLIEGVNRLLSQVRETTKCDKKI